MYDHTDRPTADDLEELPVLTQGQADDLHSDTGTVRFWLSRCSTGDGEPWDQTVTIEVLLSNGTWVDFIRYDGNDADGDGAWIEAGGFDMAVKDGWDDEA